MTKNQILVERVEHQSLCDVTPQAIFWRTIQCFAINPQESEDDLDVYLFASFAMGNQISFDLRHYAGHPKSTVTVYLSANTRDPMEIDDTLECVIQGLQVPKTGIAWRRGEDFEFGQLPRQREDRLREKEARLLALKIAAECGGHEATTEHVKKRVPEMVPLTQKDLEQSPSRPREKLWQQIVGNVISHKGTGTSLFSKGLAERTATGLRATHPQPRRWNRLPPISKGSSSMCDRAGVSQRALAQAGFSNPASYCYLLQFGNAP